MIKGLGNWIYIEILMELASYILEKKRLVRVEGSPLPCLWRNACNQRLWEMPEGKSKIIKEQPDYVLLAFEQDF